MPRAEGFRVGVVGATGMVGRELLDILAERSFPVRELLAFSSGKAGSTALFRGRRLPAPAPGKGSLLGCDLIFFVSSDEVSRRLAPALAEAGAWVLDDSSAFRLDTRVPLVIPEVNASALRPGRRLIAGPNCTMTGLAVAAAPLHRLWSCREIRLATYQAVSGAGREALDEFFGQTALARPRREADGRAPVPREAASRALPRSILFNTVPQVGAIDLRGDSGEELKVAAELRKIWSAPGLRISVTAARVPTVRGHALSAWLSFRRKPSLSAARGALRRAPGVRLHPEGSYPTPLSAGGTDPVHAGRLRPGAAPKELALWVVSDNLRKGAALNSVQIAEELLRRRWLSRRRP